MSLLVALFKLTFRRPEWPTSSTTCYVLIQTRAIILTYFQRSRHFIAIFLFKWQCHATLNPSQSPLSQWETGYVFLITTVLVLLT